MLSSGFITEASALDGRPAPTDPTNRRHAGRESSAAAVGVGAVGRRDQGRDRGRELGPCREAGLSSAWSSDTQRRLARALYCEKRRALKGRLAGCSGGRPYLGDANGERPKGVQMRRVGDGEPGNPAIRVVPRCRAGVTLGITLALVLSVPTVASGATIKVNEQAESATFVRGGNVPKDYFDRIDKLSNENRNCSLREAIAASNTNAKVDGCAAGDGPGDVVDLPAGNYPV